MVVFGLGLGLGLGLSPGCVGVVTCGVGVAVWLAP